MRINPRDSDGNPRPRLNVMVTVNGINEHGNIITDLHTLTFDSEEKLLEWIAMAPTKEKPKDDGPSVRYERPVKKV